MSRYALEGLRVLEVAESLAASYCTKLLADQGAEVVKIEGPAGDPRRWWSASTPDQPRTHTAPLYRFLNGAKRSAVIDAADLGDLIAWSEVLVTAPRADGLDGQATALLGGSSQTVHVDLSPFGRTGPLVGLPVTEFTLQGWSGAISARGSADRPPLHQGGFLGEWLTGAMAALATMAGLSELDHQGRPGHIEVSALEVMAVCLVTYPTMYRSFTGAAAALSQRGSDYPSVERCQDGWVGLCVFSSQQWADFAVMIGRPELAEDTRLSSMAARGANRAYAQEVIQPWLDEHTAEEIFELGGLFRVPVAYIGNGRTLPLMEHFSERASFVRHPGADFIQPRPPFRMSATPVRAASPAPELGADTDRVMAAVKGSGQRGVGGARPTPGTGTVPRAGTDPTATASSGGHRPLTGLKILDFTAFWAGPAGTHVLAALGADVIKIESSKRPDGIRFGTVAPPSQVDWLERSPIFQGTNPGKRSVGIDITTPAGQDLVLRLADRCDGVWENFTPRVMDNLGLGYDVLAARNPALIMVRIPGFGLDGPWKDHSGFAQTMEQVSGMGWLTGYADRNPLVRTTCDPAAGIHAAFAFLAALRHRDESGQGQLIEMAMADVAINMTAEQVIEYSAHGALLERDANRGPGGSPQGVYPSAGQEQWIALSVVTDAQWHILVDLMGRPAWAEAPELRDGTGRRAQAEAVDQQLAKWSAGHDRDQLVARLTGSGIPAAPVWPQTGIDSQPQLVARSFFQTLEHPSIGAVAYPGIGLTSSEVISSYPGPAPTLGQHTGEVLEQELGLTAAELDELSRAGVIDLVIEPSV